MQIAGCDLPVRKNEFFHSNGLLNGMKLVHIINKRKAQRQARARAKTFGTPEKPRLSVFRSNRNLYIQLIDDTQGKTLASVSTKIFAGKDKKNKTEMSKLAGEAIAKKALELHIKNAVFNKGPYKYHGRVMAVCEGARAAGLTL